jgi:hypothetical protein
VLRSRAIVCPFRFPDEKVKTFNRKLSMRLFSRGAYRWPLSFPSMPSNSGPTHAIHSSSGVPRLNTRRCRKCGNPERTSVSRISAQLHRFSSKNRRGRFLGGDLRVEGSRLAFPTDCLFDLLL